MLRQLVDTLVQSRNGAADEVLVEALRLGSVPEQSLALDALLRRGTVAGLAGVVGLWGQLPEALRRVVLERIGQFHAALRQCARGTGQEEAAAAVELIAAGRQGKLTYLVTEALHHTDEPVARAAAQALLSLAQWVVQAGRRLTELADASADSPPGQERAAVYGRLLEERPEIEQAVARAMEVHRGRFGAEILRAALLLADSPLSRTLAILTTPRHGGQAAMLRRLQQPPEPEFVEAFLLAATQASVRSSFGAVFAHLAEPAALDRLLARTHWLKDHRLQLCVRQVNRGVWYGEDLDRDLARRDNRDVARVADWIVAGGLHGVVQDQKLERVREHLAADTAGRLRLLRLLLGRGRGAPVGLLRTMVADADERLARMAAREIVRRRPPDYENLLVQAIVPGMPVSVRRIIGRAVGQSGFEIFWKRWESLDGTTRRSAGRGMMKLLPDRVTLLERRLRSGPVEQRLKAIAMVQELGLAGELVETVAALCADPHPRIRSKAVMLLGQVPHAAPEPVLDRVLQDQDPRVRANAIEVLEAQRREDAIPLLAQRARMSHNRERANATRALHRMRLGAATQQLQAMLQDQRSEHRISALWALRQIGWWDMLGEVARLAREDKNLRVRRYALGILRGVSEMFEAGQGPVRRQAAG